MLELGGSPNRRNIDGFEQMVEDFNRFLRRRCSGKRLGFIPYPTPAPDWSKLCALQPGHCSLTSMKGALVASVPLCAPQFIAYDAVGTTGRRSGATLVEKGLGAQSLKLGQMWFAGKTGRFLNHLLHISSRNHIGDGSASSLSHPTENTPALACACTSWL